MTENIVEKNVIEGKGFLCPWHGLEIEVFCFRAYDLLLSDKWVNITTTITPVDEKQSPWHPAGEKPEKDGEYLVTWLYEETRMYGTDNWIKDEGWEYEEGIDFWMPIPQLPKETK